jgi:hypothetical protein
MSLTVARTRDRQDGGGVSTDRSGCGGALQSDAKIWTTMSTDPREYILSLSMISNTVAIPLIGRFQSDMLNPWTD